MVRTCLFMVFVGYERNGGGGGGGGEGGSGKDRRLAAVGRAYES